MNRQPISMSKITALCSRLSKDDERLGESLSIENQRSILEDYAKKQGFTNISHYVDDGFSGTDFSRPDWKRMIADIEADKVGIVICKDLSRLGRDHLQVGFHTEVVFRKHNVRFIAIGNNIDSNIQEALVLEAIQAVSGFVKDSEDEFITLVREAHDLQTVETAKSQQKQLAKSQKRHKELDSLIKQLYEDKVKATTKQDNTSLVICDYVESSKQAAYEDGMRAGAQLIINLLYGRTTAV